MKLHTEQEYKKAKARLTQLSRHGDYADAAEFENLADAIEAWENVLVREDLLENEGA